jgi:putative ABC transport system permease protein
MDALLKDLRLAFRVALKNPGLSLIVILTFSLGIGLTTTVFSIVNGVIFKGLPFEEPRRIVAVGETNLEQNIPFTGVTVHNLRDWQEEQTAFDALGAWGGIALNVGAQEGRPVRLNGALLTREIFDVIRVQPVLGRAFTEEDLQPGSPSVIILGHDVWQDQFEGAADVIGQNVRVNGEIRTVIGVMPEGFRFPNLQDARLPLAADPTGVPRGQGGRYQVLGRLRDQVSVEEARVQIAGIARRLEEAHPESNEGIGAAVRPFSEVLGSQLYRLLYTMLGAVLAVMLIACVNVANLLIARATSRTREMAVRTALGAGRGRVVSQLLTEVLLLAFIGGLVGFGLGTLGIEWFKRVIEVNPPPSWIRFDHDYRVVLFTLAVTILAAVASGVVPALQATKGNVGNALKDQNRGSSSFRMNKLTGGLVTAEVALSCCLLVAAGLMIKSVTQLRTLDLPFTTDNVFTARINLPMADYPDTLSRVTLYDQLLERVQTIPGVEAATLSDGLPAAGNGVRIFEVEGQEYGEVEDRPGAREGIVTPGYFDTFQTELIRGRPFRVSDRAGALPVCIVNETFARNYLGGDALGRRIRKRPPDTEFQNTENEWLTVVGVVPDMLMQGIGNNEASPAGFYIPIGQSDVGFTVVIALRTLRDPMSKTPDVRAAVAAVDPNLPIFQILDMQGVIDRQTFFYTIFGKLFMAFGFAALFLAGVGLYGVMSFAVAQRTQEMGVRMAHGAQARQLIALVMGRGARQLGIGLGIGLALAVLAAGQVQVLLFEVDARDPVVFGAVLVTLAASGFMASFIPARRVTKVDPVTALTPV